MAQKYSDPIKFRSRSAFKLVEIENKYHFLLHKDVRCIVELGAAPGGWSQILAHKLGWLEEDIIGTDKPPLDDHVDPREETSTPSNDMWSDASRQIPAEEEVDLSRDLVDDEEPEKRARALSTIIAVDKLRMDPIAGVNRLQMDFLSPEADAAISSLVDMTSPESKGKVDIVLSDMAGNITGKKIHDREVSLELAHAVLQFSIKHLRTAEDTGRSRGGVLM